MVQAGVDILRGDLPIFSEIMITGKNQTRHFIRYVQAAGLQILRSGTLPPQRIKRIAGIGEFVRLSHQIGGGDGGPQKRQTGDQFGVKFPPV